MTRLIESGTGSDNAGLTKEQCLASRKDVNVWCELFSGEAQGDYHRDIQSAAATYKNLIIEGAPNSGKSQQITLRRTLWAIGNDPDIRIQITCAAASKASDWVRQIADGLRSDIFRAVFPEIRCSSPWTGDQINVRKTKTNRQGATVRGTGIESSVNLGGRVDIMILDDVLTPENTYSRAQREQIIRKVKSSAIAGRIVPGGRTIVIGNTWTRDDLIHELASMRNDAGELVYHYIRTAACDEAVTVSHIPQIWTIEALREKRDELGTIAFNCLFLCQPMGDEDSRFNLSWFDKASPIPWSTSYIARPGERVSIGIDPGIGQDRQHDPTAMCALLRDANGRHHVLCVESGHWTGEGTIDKMVEWEKRYPGCVFRVEAIAAQRFLIQWAANRVRSPIMAHNTNASASSVSGKVWAFERLPMEVERGNLLICRNKDNSMTNEGAGLRDGLMSYRPGIHTDDRVMALVMAYAQHHAWLGGQVRVERRV